MISLYWPRGRVWRVFSVVLVVCLSCSLSPYLVRMCLPSSCFIDECCYRLVLRGYGHYLVIKCVRITSLLWLLVPRIILRGFYTFIAAGRGVLVVPSSRKIVGRPTRP